MSSWPAKRKFLREKVKSEMKRNNELLEQANKARNLVARSKLMSNMERGRLALLSNKVRDLRRAWGELRKTEDAQNT